MKNKPTPYSASVSHPCASVADHSEIAPMLDRARSIYAKILAGENGMLRRRDALLWRSWQLGETLSALKFEIGHGKWLHWLGGHLPDLAPRTASRAMLLFSGNPNAQNFADLSVDSVRTFMFGYVPAKERPELPGDQNITLAPHPLTFTNHFLKWDNQCEKGLIPRADVETMRRDFEPVVKRLVDLVGKEWLSSLLG